MTNSFCSSSASLVSALSCRSGAGEPANSSASSPDTPDTSLDNACIRDGAKDTPNTAFNRGCVSMSKLYAMCSHCITHAWGVTYTLDLTLNTSAYCNKPGEMSIILH